jgi:diguanylate cyclase (GGDEF)-like protein
MQHIEIVFSGILFISTTVAIMMAIYSLKHTQMPGSMYFGYFCVVIALYCFGYGMELINDSYKNAMFWNGFQYLGIPFICILGSCMAFDYTGNKLFLKWKGKLWIVFLIPISIVMMRMTNNIHHLYYTKAYIASNGYFNVLKLEKGLFYYYYMLYITFFGLYSSIVYLKAIWQAYSVSRIPMLMMFLATLCPWTAAYLNMTNTAPYGIDFSAVTFALSLIICMVGIFRFGMLKTIPIARDAVFYNAKEGIIILNNNNCIIDFNNVAKEMFRELNGNSIFQKFYVLFPDWPKLDNISDENIYEFTKEKSDGLHYYTSSTIFLKKNNSYVIGSIITVTDITKHIETQKQLEVLATVDSLTGLYNRRFLYNNFTRELNRTSRYGNSLSVVMFDLDHFKIVNDVYGHLAGDEVLKQVAAISNACVRSADILARYGGEEFFILLPETRITEAVELAERIRKEIEGILFVFGDRECKVTASFGVTGFDSYIPEATVDSLINKADQALYDAKSSGRNKVVLLS